MPLASWIELRQSSSRLRLTVFRQNLKVPARMLRHGWEYRLLPKELGRRHVMIAKDRGRGLRLFGFVLAAVVDRLGLLRRSRRTSRSRDSRCRRRRRERRRRGPPAKGKKTVRLDEIDAPALQSTQIPVNPTDPISIVNGQVDHPAAAGRRVHGSQGQGDRRALDPPHAGRAGAPGQEARGHRGRDRSGDRDGRQAVRNRPRGLAAHAGQGARDQPDAVRPGHHLPGPRAAETVRGPGPGHARTT